MRRLLTILFVAFLFTAHGQDFIKSGGKFVSLSGNFVKASTAVAPPAYIFQPETQAFWLRLADSTAVDISWKYDFDSLVIYLKDTNIWQSADAMYLYAFENASDALLNIVGDTNNSTTVSTMNFTKAEGYKSNGSSGYINTHFNPNTEGVNYLQGDACLAVFLNETGSNTGFERQIGISNAAVTTAAWLPASINASYSLNNGATFSGTRGTTNLSAITRLDGANVTIYYDGSFATTGNVANGVPNYEFYAFTLNYDGSPLGGFSSSELSIVYIGGGLSQDQITRFEDIMQWWLTKVSDNP